MNNNGNGSDMAMMMGKYLLLVTLIIGFFVETKKTYIVEDEVTGQTFSVNNVPIGIGETFSLFTLLEKNLSKAFETAFATPNSISYSKVGLGFTMSAPLNLGQSYFIDPYTNRNFNEYIDNCVISAIAAGEKGGDVLSVSKDLETDLRVVGYLTPYYSSTTPNGVDKTCEDTWDLLKNDIAVKLDAMEQKAASKSMIEQSAFSSGMAETSKLLFGISQTSTDYLMQQTLINMTKSGLQAAALATGGDASAIAYAKALSETNQQQTWQMTGILTQQNLPLMKAVFTVLVLGIFMLLVILSLVYGNIGHIKMGFTLLFAMVLWTPLAILINGMFNEAIERMLPSISSGGMNMTNVSEIGSNLKNYLSFLGYLAASIPVFAYSLAKMSEHGFVSFFGGVGGASTSAASSATSQTSSGNLSAGNSRLGTFNAVDQHGSHDFLGGDGFRHQSLSGSGAMNSSNVNGAGLGTIHTDAAGNADVKMDRPSGKVLSVGGLALSTGVADTVNTAKQTAFNTAQSDGVAFNTAAASNITNGLSKNGTEIDTTTTGHNFGYNEQTNETLSKATNEAAKSTWSDMFSNGKTYSFTGENGVTGTVGAGFDGKLLGFGLKADGSVSLTGKTSDGKNFNHTLSGGDAKDFTESFNKNLSKSIGETKGLSKALAEQVQTTKGFGDSDLVSKADTYSKSMSKVDTLTDSISVGSNNQMTFSQDLNPQIMNKLIDNATYDNYGQKVKLSDLRAGNDDDKALAATFAARMMKSPEYQEDVLKAFGDVTGGKVDFTQTKGVQGDLTHAQREINSNTTQRIEDGKNLTNTVDNRVSHVSQSVSDAPKNQSDIDKKEKELVTQYDKDEAKLKTNAKKDLTSFENNNDLGVKKVIDQKNGTLEDDFNQANLDVGVTSAMKQNPAIAGLIKTGNEVGDLIEGAAEKVSSTYGADGNIYNGGQKTGEWSNKRVDVKKQIETNEDRNEKAYEKAIKSGLVEDGIYSDEINPSKMKKTDTETLKMVYQESKDMTSGMSDKSDDLLKKELESRGVHFTQSGNNVFDKNITTDKNVIGLVEQREQSAHKQKGGMGGDALDGGSGTDTFQPPLPEVTTKIQEQPKQQVAEQVSRPQIVSEQPIQSKDDFTKSMMDKGVFEDKSGSNVNWDKFSKLEQQEVDTYMNHFAKDANAAENQNDFNRNSQPTISNNQNSGTQNFESQLESRREPERVQTTQPREQSVEQPRQQPQEITRPQAVDEHISKSNLETEEGQRLKEQNEESTQSIKKLFKELEELKDS
jgi:conjugal transfer mating pair stabilization protein TraG